MTPAAITVADARPHRLGGAGASTAASIAAGAMVLVCVVARLPEHLLQVTGRRSWAVALVAVIALVNGARTIAQAPFTFAQRRGSRRRWAVTQLAVLGSTIAVGAALTLPLYALIRASSAWWLWAWALFALVTVAGQLAMPLIVRAQSGPLQAAPAPLIARARSVADRAGVDLGGGVVVATKATGPGKAGPGGHQQGPRCNAYLVGFGATRRVVLEPGLAAWPPELIDQVLAHEFGHWRLGHTARRLPLTIAAQLVTFALAAAVLSFSPLLALAGVTAAADPRSYPLLLALTAVVVLPARLMLAGFDRAQERAADRFALTALAAPTDFAAMLDRAAVDGGAARHLPWWRKVAATHPPIDERVLACQRPAPAPPSSQRGLPTMSHRRSFRGITTTGAAAVTVVALIALGGCGQSGGRSSALSVPAASRTAASGPAASAVPGAPAPSALPATAAATATSPAATVAPTAGAGHHSVSTSPTPTTRPTTTTSQVARPSGPAPAAPGIYTYRQVGSLPGTPAQGTLVVAPVSASGTQVWTRAVGGTVAPASSVMLFNATGAYLVSPGAQVAGAGASCTFASPVPWPSWPTTTGQRFSAPARCTGGVTTYLMTGSVTGTATVSLAGQAVNVAVVVNTITVKGSVDGDSFNITMTETDDFAPTLRIPVVTVTQVKGTAIGIPISTTRTDTLVSATPS